MSRVLEYTLIKRALFRFTRALKMFLYTFIHIQIWGSLNSHMFCTNIWNLSYDCIQKGQRAEQNGYRRLTINTNMFLESNQLIVLSFIQNLRTRHYLARLNERTQVTRSAPRTRVKITFTTRETTRSHYSSKIKKAFLELLVKYTNKML